MSINVPATLLLLAAVMPLTVMAPLVAPSPVLPVSETNSVAAAMHVG